MEKHSVRIKRGRTEIHRYQCMVERYNRTFAERLFDDQYAKKNYKIHTNAVANRSKDNLRLSRLK